MKIFTVHDQDSLTVFDTLLDSNRSYEDTMKFLQYNWKSLPINVQSYLAAKSEEMSNRAEKVNRIILGDKRE